MLITPPWSWSHLRSRADTLQNGVLPILIAGLLGLAGCSPTLNWRSVALGESSVTLPCKPDRGERIVVLGSSSVKMEMVGCEADGALFAISRVRLPEGLAPELLQAQWQSSTLQQMGAQPDVASASRPGGTTRLPVKVIIAQGQRADGRPLQANLAWVAVGSDLVHLAVYADRLTHEQTEPFFDGIRSQ